MSNNNKIFCSKMLQKKWDCLIKIFVYKMLQKDYFLRTKSRKSIEKKTILWQNVVGLSPDLNCITLAHSVTERYLLI